MRCPTQSVFTEEASPEKALQERVALARQYIGEGNWDAAKRNLKLAKEINPNSPEVHEAFALIYWRTGEYEMAEENFKDAIRMKKNFSRCRNNYAAFLYSQERYEEAEKQLEGRQAQAQRTSPHSDAVNKRDCGL